MSLSFDKNIVFKMLNTEKSCASRDVGGVLVFFVNKKSTKSMVAKEVERVLEAKVDSVNILCGVKAGRVFRGVRSNTKCFKKAYVKINKSAGFDFNKLQQ